MVRVIFVWHLKRLQLPAMPYACHRFIMHWITLKTKYNKGMAIMSYSQWRSYCTISVRWFHLFFFIFIFIFIFRSSFLSYAFIVIWQLNSLQNVLQGYSFTCSNRVQAKQRRFPQNQTFKRWTFTCRALERKLNYLFWNGNANDKHWCICRA